MTFYVTNQNYVILSLLSVGFIIGVVYDIFKIKREIFGAKLWIYILDDLCFSFIYTVIFVFAIFLTNYGYVRWYEFISALLGFVLYKSTISSIFVKISLSIVRFIIKILKLAIAIVLKPTMTILSFIISCIKKLYCIILTKYITSKTRNKSKRKLKREINLSRKGFYKT